MAGLEHEREERERAAMEAEEAYTRECLAFGAHMEKEEVPAPPSNSRIRWACTNLSPASFAPADLPILKT